MSTVFDKARENVASLAADFTYSSALEHPYTRQALNAVGLMQVYAYLMRDMVSDYGAKTVQINVSPCALDRYQFRFALTPKTPDSEYISVLRFWNDLNVLRENGDDTILVMPDEHNLPILSCDAWNMHTILRQNADNHGMTKYYKEHFDMIEACLQRLSMGERAGLRMN